MNDLPMRGQCTPLSQLNGVALANVAGTHDLTIVDGTIATIRPSKLLRAQWLALPGLANMHAHADRSFTGADDIARSLSDAIAHAVTLRQHASEEDFFLRSAKLFDRVLKHGTTRLRTHTDVDDLVGNRAIAGVLAARKQFAGKLDVEVVAFANARGDPTTEDQHRRLVDAVHAGADLLGAVPAHTSDPRRCVDSMLDLAATLDVAVDFHLDEHGSNAHMLSEYVAEGVIARSLQSRVTISHACALAMLAPDALRRVCERMALAGIDVVALPATNLHLQDRGDATPRRRGLTMVRELLHAGVAVHFGTDNVRDCFFPLGDGDMLECAFLAMMMGQLDDMRALLEGVTGGRGDLTVGSAADLVLVPAGSFLDAIARRPEGRIVLRHGDIVAGGT